MAPADPQGAPSWPSTISTSSHLLHERGRSSGPGPLAKLRPQTGHWLLPWVHRRSYGSSAPPAAQSASAPQQILGLGGQSRLV